MCRVSPAKKLLAFVTCIPRPNKKVCGEIASLVPSLRPARQGRGEARHDTGLRSFDFPPHTSLFSDAATRCPGEPDPMPDPCTAPAHTEETARGRGAAEIDHVAWRLTAFYAMTWPFSNKVRCISLSPQAVFWSRRCLCGQVFPQQYVP